MTKEPKLTYTALETGLHFISTHFIIDPKHYIVDEELENWKRCREIEEIERKKGFFKIKGDEWQRC